MKKLFILLLIALVAFAAVGTGTATAQDAPKGTWLGTWPYAAPGTHNLNSFATGGLNDNLGLVYRPLVELTPAYYLWATSEYTPILAEKWGFTADNSAYEYTLKAGAKWSNGDTITTADVVNTFALGRLAGWSVWSSLSEVVAVDERTARFVFQEGKASLLAERLILKEHVIASKNYGELAAAALELFKAGKTKDDQEWKDLNTKLTEFRPAELIASGPYTYALSDVGEAFMTLKWQPNSLYSGSTKFGDLKLWAGETEATTALVLSGELAHSTNVYPPATVESFVQAGIRLVNTPRGYGPVLLFNFKVAPFDKKEVRQAMAYAINREQSALLTNGTGASGTVYMSGILDSQTPNLLSKETIDQLNRYPNDLKKAEEAMAAAGFTRNADGKWADADGKTISVEYTFPADFADFSAAARDATAQLNEFGFDITERALPWQEARDAIRAGNFALSVWSWGAGSPFAFSHLNNPIRRWTSATLPAEQPGLNFDLKFDYNGEAVDLNALILNVDAGLDPAVHKANAGKISLMLNDLMLYIPLNEMLSVEPLNEKSISGVPADGDPIYQNPSNDHFIVLLILNGTLGPVN
jgi:peptide/nickel transport system substrate-binding protein